MKALDYYALEGDVERIKIGLKKTKFNSIIEANIFGHTFIDLICLACDPQFGGYDKDVLDILEEIRPCLSLKTLIDKRIKFLKTGQDDFCFSYNIDAKLEERITAKEKTRLEAKRLSLINQRLMSMGHFSKLKSNKALSLEETMEEILKQMLIMEVKQLNEYPKKEEFETIVVYKNRCRVFIDYYLRNKAYIDKYKVQKRPAIDKIRRQVKKDRAYLLEESFALVDKSLNDLNVLELYNLYFPINPMKIGIGNYDASQEVFFMYVDGQVKKLGVPLAIAREFREEFATLNPRFERIIEKDKIIDKLIYKFKNKEARLLLYERETSLQTK